jgi:hypothetical protein
VAEVDESEAGLTTAAAAAAAAEDPPAHATLNQGGGAPSALASRLRPGLIRDSVRMTAEKGAPSSQAAAPPPSPAAASHLRPAMLRDSRRLAHAPRRNNNFQASVRQSLRKRRGQPGAGQQNNVGQERQRHRHAVVAVPEASLLTRHPLASLPFHSTQRPPPPWKMHR